MTIKTYFSKTEQGVQNQLILNMIASAELFNKVGNKH